jgi:hypothetical protein
VSIQAFFVEPHKEAIIHQLSQLGGTAHLSCHNLPITEHGMNPSYYNALCPMPFSCLKHGLTGGIMNAPSCPEKLPQQPILTSFIRLNTDFHRPPCMVFVLMEMQRISHQGLILYVYPPASEVFSKEKN